MEVGRGWGGGGSLILHFLNWLFSAGSETSIDGPRPMFWARGRERDGSSGDLTTLGSNLTHSLISHGRRPRIGRAFSPGGRPREFGRAGAASTTAPRSVLISKPSRTRPTAEVSRQPPRGRVRRGPTTLLVVQGHHGT